MTKATGLNHSDITIEMTVEIDRVIEAHKHVDGSVIAVLRKCQDIVGYLPPELIDYIGRGMALPPSQVYGVASFYSLFSMTPKGRHTVKICMGTACYVKGIKEVVNRIANKYHVDLGETSEDRRFSFEPVRCLGACGLAPVMVVNSDTHGDVSSDTIIDLLEKYE